MTRRLLETRRPVYSPTTPNTAYGSNSRPRMPRPAEGLEDKYYTSLHAI